jgi:hypothetical protein
MSEITQADIAAAKRNDPIGTFTLANPKTGETRTFEMRDLDYDAYLEFMELARPIILAVSGAVSLNSSGGEIALNFDPAGLDFVELLKVAGKELPKMVWLCARASDKNIKIEDIKRLARRPYPLLEVVLKQVKHNELVKEFADAFPLIAKALENLAPDTKQAIQPVSTGATA